MITRWWASSSAAAAAATATANSTATANAASGGCGGCRRNFVAIVVSCHHQRHTVASPVVSSLLNHHRSWQRHVAAVNTGMMLLCVRRKNTSSKKSSSSSSRKKAKQQQHHHHHHHKPKQPPPQHTGGGSSSSSRNKGKKKTKAAEAKASKTSAVSDVSNNQVSQSSVQESKFSNQQQPQQQLLNFFGMANTLASSPLTSTTTTTTSIQTFISSMGNQFVQQFRHYVSETFSPVPEDVILKLSTDWSPIYFYGCSSNLIRWMQGITLGMIGMFGLHELERYQQERRQKQDLLLQAAATASPAILVVNKTDSNPNTAVVVGDEWVSVWQYPQQQQQQVQQQQDQQQHDQQDQQQRLLYILGTTHGSSKSVEMVQQLIQHVRPQAVFIEQDEYRIASHHSKMPLPIPFSLWASLLFNKKNTNNNNNNNTTNTNNKNNNKMIQSNHEHNSDERTTGTNAATATPDATAAVAVAAAATPTADFAVDTNYDHVTWLIPRQTIPYYYWQQLWQTLFMRSHTNTSNLLVGDDKFYPQTLSFPKTFRNMNQQELPAAAAAAVSTTAAVNHPQLYDDDDDEDVIMNESLHAIWYGQNVGACLVLGDQPWKRTVARLQGAVRWEFLDSLFVPRWKRLMEQQQQQEVTDEEEETASTTLTTTTTTGKETKTKKKKYTPQELSEMLLLGGTKLGEMDGSKQFIQEVVTLIKNVMPNVYRVMLTERDDYMTDLLHALFATSLSSSWSSQSQQQQQLQLDKVVAIFGKAHVDGIEQRLQKHGWKQVQVVVTPAPAETEKQGAIDAIDEPPSLAGNAAAATVPTN